MEHKVLKNGKEIALTRLEFDLLVALAKEPGRVFTREALLNEVWGYQHAADTRLVNVHVQRLRSKIETDADNPEYVLTVRIKILLNSIITGLAWQLYQYLLSFYTRITMLM